MIYTKPGGGSLGADEKESVMRTLSGMVRQKLDNLFLSEEICSKVDAIPNQVNELGYDNWGMNPEYLKRVLSATQWIFDKYFRVEVHHIERVPPGRVLVVPNHSGQLPLDGAFLIYAMLKYANPPRVLRAMVERLMPRLPFISTLMVRCGEVVGDPVNCKRLLEHGEAVLVFPEGVRGSGKLYWQRYKLQRFGTGFVRLALETDTPVVPVAVIGAEETYPAIYNMKTVAALLKLPYCPITPFWPLLGPLGVVPMPAKIHIYFGEPIHMEGDFDGPEHFIQQKVDRIAQSIQSLIDRGLKERGKKYF